MIPKKVVHIEEDYVKWFSDLSNNDAATVGGKGASLGEMYNHNFPVPPGFVITAQAFDMFMGPELKNELRRIIEGIDLEDTAQLQKASREIRDLIEKQEIPRGLREEILESYHILSSSGRNENRGVSQDALNILRLGHEPIFVSVRSSATTEDSVEASFAGQQESFLNVKGDDNLLLYVRKCFSSLYTARAIYYRNKKGFKEGQSLLAVVVQKMVNSESSGIVFSRDPVTLRDEVIVESVYGLGEGIVSGQINPDHFVVSRDLEIKETKLSDKKIAIIRTGAGKNETVKLSHEKSKSQSLTNGEVLELGDLAVRLEEHYKRPQDIEFAVEDSKVYIVQSRPITTKATKEDKNETISGKVLLTGSGASPGIGVGVVKIVKTMADLSKIKKGDILVTEMTNPDMVVSMQKSVAIVTDEGGMTSHASIVSREMGIPCVVGTGEATKVLKDGMKITVDGRSGKVYEGEVAKTTISEIKKAVPTSRIKIKVIVDLPEFAERAAQSGIDSIGLTRLEGIIASSNKHLLYYEKENTLKEYVELLRVGIEKISKPFILMWIRTSDIRTDEYSSLKGAPEREINPMLGLHGARFSLKHPSILRAELEAIRKVADKHPTKKFGVMFPQIISVKEVIELKKYYNEFKRENMQFGVMVETPAAVQVIEDICKEGIEFISFGTNDLTQFTLAVDRGEEDVQYLYNELDPAIFSQIKRVIEVCRKYNVETSICGQAGSKLEMVEFLFKAGISSISVNADAAFDVSSLVKKLEDNPPKDMNRNIEVTNINNSSKIIQHNKPHNPHLNNNVNDKINPRIVDCAKCKKQTKLPFVPKNDRDYFCKECFSKQPKLPKLPRTSEDSQQVSIRDIREHEEELKETMLNENRIKIRAHQANLGEIEPFNNLENIEEASEDILEDVQESNHEKRESNRRIEDNIETDEAKVIDEEENGDSAEEMI